MDGVVDLISVEEESAFIMKAERSQRLLRGNYYYYHTQGQSRVEHSHLLQPLKSLKLVSDDLIIPKKSIYVLYSM